MNGHHARSSCPESWRPVGTLRLRTCPWVAQLPVCPELYAYRERECNRDQFGGQLRGSGGAIPDFKITRTGAGETA